MNDAQLMKGARRLTDLGGNAGGLGLRQHAALFDQRLRGLAGHVVVDHHKLVRQLVGCLHARQPRAGALPQRGPHAAARHLCGNLLAHKGTGALDGHQLGELPRASGQHALDMVHVVKRHGMHDLRVVQALPHPA